MFFSASVLTEDGFVFAQSQKSKTNTSAKTQKKKQEKTQGKQDLNYLNQQKSETQERIERTNKKIETTRQTAIQTLREVEQIDEGIRQRNLSIQSQTTEILELDKKITVLSKDILRKELDLSNIKQKYVDLIYHAYVKNSGYSKLMFVLSSETFQEMYRRFRYIQNFAELRKAQAEEIASAKEELVSKRTELTVAKERCQNLLKIREEEQKKLIAEKALKGKLVLSLQDKEKELTQELVRQQSNAEAIEVKIQALIEEVARAEAKRLAEEEKQKKQVVANAGKTEMTIFEKQKGKLPNPMPGGKITGRFGTQKHPVLEHVMVNNKGIYITSSKESVACSVSSGEVKQKFSVPGSNNAVIIRHGSYLTVYSNLSTVSVKVGDNVTAGQKVGDVYKDTEDNNRSTLFFQVWKEKELQNPEHWLKPIK